MKATEAKLLSFLKKTSQFVIPIYQRTYSWTGKDCQQLWDDVIRAGNSDSIPVHFLGAIVYIEQGISQVTHQAPLLVIDGQQRLTTVTLLIAALADALGEMEAMDGFSARKLRNYYLRNPEENDERYFKLLLSQTDKDSLKAIVAGHEQPKEKSIRITQNFELFQQLVQTSKEDFPVICRGLAKLIIVDIALSRDQDNPQLIFESMNSTGKELSQADLIRNHVLMGLEQKLQTKMYERYWRPMELEFGQEAYSTHFDGFMRHYLTLKTGEIPKVGAVYEVFKLYAHPVIEKQGVEALVKDMQRFSHYYCAMALGAETDQELKLSFNDLKELRVDVAYPLLLELYSDYTQGVLKKIEFWEIVRLIESYVFRRAISAIPTNSMNKIFSTFSNCINKEKYLESIKAHFLLLPSYRRFPSNDEFQREIKTRDLYNFRSRSYWLRRMENFDRKERVRVNEYTIEHILPQNEDLSDKWKEALGEEWERIQQTWLHTLGNLTLTGYNSEYSDKPFEEKRDMRNGFGHSPIHLSAGLGECEEWTEYAIKNRAKHLSELALQVWTVPKLSVQTLAEYKPQKGKKTRGSIYSIEDHPKLTSASVSPLFKAFRKEVFALDSCVSEEMLKLYIAYKAETNFVDIVPQSKGLKLYLNLAFCEISDPKGRCKDVTKLGRWSNGDIEVKLTTLGDLPYVMGLVRQSLEKQMDEE